MIHAEIRVTLFDDEQQLGSAMGVVRPTRCLTDVENPTIMLSDVGFIAQRLARAANALGPCARFYPETG